VARKLQPSAASEASTNTPWREGKAWDVGEFIDGRVNLRGETAIGAAGLLSLACSYLEHCEQELTANNVEYMAKTLGAVIQSACTKTIGHADLHSMAHTRARGLLRDVLPSVPSFPYGGDKTLIQRWLSRTTNILATRLEILIELCGTESEPVDFLALKPWLQFASGVN